MNSLIGWILIVVMTSIVVGLIAAFAANALGYFN